MSLSDPGIVQRAGDGPASLAEAVDAFLAQAPPAPGYTHAEMASYRALCRQMADGPPQVELVLLAASDGAIYLPEVPEVPEVPNRATLQSAAAAEVLRQRRFRPTESTLAIRLPASIAGGAGSTHVFTQWASPKYLAAGSAPTRVWK